MESQRQLLRVSVKLMGLTVIIFLLYILFKGMFVSLDDTNKKIVVDVSALQPGQFKTLNFNGRKVLLLHRNKIMMAALAAHNAQLYNDVVNDKVATEWFVAYAHDPLLGCEIQLSDDKKTLVSVCGDQRYDLAGRPYKNQQSQMKLLSPAFAVREWDMVITSK